jgi:hypothetical protein
MMDIPLKMMISQSIYLMDGGIVRTLQFLGSLGFCHS